MKLNLGHLTLALSLSTLLPGKAIAQNLPIPASRALADGVPKAPVLVYVGKGFETKINFIPTGERVIEASLGYPGRFTVSGNGLCPAMGQTQPCNSTGAAIVTIRQTTGIPFEYLSQSKDGKTNLSLTTRTPSGRLNLYEVILVPTATKPPQTTITLTPDTPGIPPDTPILEAKRPAPVLPPRTSTLQAQRPTVPQPTPTPIAGSPEEGSAHLTPRSPEPSIPELFAQIPHVMPTAPKEGQKPDPSAAIAAAPSPRPINRITPQTAPTQTAIAPQPATPTRTTTIAPQPARTITPSVTPPITVALISTSLPDNPHTLANRIVSGLVIANQNGQIRRYTSTFNKAQNAIAFLRQGRSLAQAAQRANVPLKTLEQLIRWGQRQ